MPERAARQLLHKEENARGEGKSSSRARAPNEIMRMRHLFPVVFPQNCSGSRAGCRRQQLPRRPKGAALVSPAARAIHLGRGEA